MGPPLGHYNPVVVIWVRFKARIRVKVIVEISIKVRARVVVMFGIRVVSVVV